MTALLALTMLLMIVSIGMFVAGFRRNDPFPAFAGMTVMLVAAIPAAAYAGLS